MSPTVIFVLVLFGCFWWPSLVQRCNVEVSYLNLAFFFFNFPIHKITKMADTVDFRYLEGTWQIDSSYQEYEFSKLWRHENQNGFGRHSKYFLFSLSMFWSVFKDSDYVFFLSKNVMFSTEIWCIYCQVHTKFLSFFPEHWQSILRAQNQMTKAAGLQNQSTVRMYRVTLPFTYLASLFGYSLDLNFD